MVDWQETLLHAARGPAHWPSRGAPDMQTKRMREEAEEMVEEEHEEDNDSMDLWGALLHNSPSPRTSFVYNLRKGPLRGAIRLVMVVVLRLLPIFFHHSFYSVTLPYSVTSCDLQPVSHLSLIIFRVS